MLLIWQVFGSEWLLSSNAPKPYLPTIFLGGVWGWVFFGIYACAVMFLAKDAGSQYCKCSGIRPGWIWLGIKGSRWWHRGPLAQGSLLSLGFGSFRGLKVGHFRLEDAALLTQRFARHVPQPPRSFFCEAGLFWCLGWYAVSGVTLALPNRFQFLKGGTALGASCT